MTRTDLYEAIKARIQTNDRHEVLSEERVHELATDYTSFVDQASNKYIAGQKEHGGKLEDRNTILEAEKEVLDLFHYIQDAKRKFSPTNLD